MEVERITLFESARDKAAEEYLRSPLDADDPHNEHYLKALEMAKKAPSLHREILKQFTSEQVEVNEAMNIEGSSSQAIRKKKNSDFKYDMLGWVTLTIGIIAWVGLARSALQLHLPSPTYA